MGQPVAQTQGHQVLLVLVLGAKGLTHGRIVQQDRAVVDPKGREAAANRTPKPRRHGGVTRVHGRMPTRRRHRARTFCRGGQSRVGVAASGVGPFRGQPGVVAWRGWCQAARPCSRPTKPKQLSGERRSAQGIVTEGGDAFLATLHCLSLSKACRWPKMWLREGERQRARVEIGPAAAAGCAQLRPDLNHARP